MGHSSMDPASHELPRWNEGRLIGAKRALKQQRVWAIRFWLDQHRRLRDRALFDFAIDSKLRGCDVVRVRIGDVVSSGQIRDRAIVVQQKTKRPVQFELLDTRLAKRCARGWNVDAAPSTTSSSACWPVRPPGNMSVGRGPQTIWSVDDLCS